MASIHIPDEGRSLERTDEIVPFLTRFGIWYRRFEAIEDLSPEATDADILTAFSAPIEELRATGGYTTADVINVHPDTPGLDAMLARFNKEHWHDEDEVRFVVGGRGLFHIHPNEGPVFSIEVERGDMILVPKGTHHWFDLCANRSIRAIRLFQNTAGWTPRYTESGVDSRFQPLCFGYQGVPLPSL